LFDVTKTYGNGIALYMFTDNGYPFIIWIMTPYKEIKSIPYLEFYIIKNNEGIM